jgi:hypothetical protein
MKRCVRHLELVDDVEHGLAVDGEERDGREVLRLELGEELPRAEGCKIPQRQQKRTSHTVSSSSSLLMI